MKNNLTSLHPTDDLTEENANAIAALSPEKRALLEHKLKQHANGPPARPITALSQSRPLSYAQQRLWFLDQLEHGSALYSIPLCLRLSGKLNVDILHKALNTIIDRHEALRTTFHNHEGEPVQVIAPNLVLDIPTVDLSALPKEEREQQVQRLSKEDSLQAFDLTRGPLLRATLLHLAEQDHVLLLTMHHIISDGWSMGVFNREFGALYEAFIADKKSPLPELPTQYADFAQWQRQWMQGEVLDSQLSYWKEQLKGVPPLLELDTDWPRPALQSYSGAKQTCLLSSELTCALKTLSQQEGVTLFMTLLAAFQILLYRHTSQDDIVIGAPIASRTRVELENLIGFFVNSLVLRGDMSGNPTFKELLGRVREVALGAYAHQDLPFEKLVQELQPERNLSRNPLFDFMINYHINLQTAIELPDLTINTIEPTEPESKFTMTLYISEQENRIELKFVYQDVLFSPERVQLLLDQLHFLLEQIVSSPQKQIDSYSLVTERTRSMLPDPAMPIPVPVYELTTNMFSSWVKQSPASVAINQGEHQWSYSELAESSYKLAHLLCAQGIKKGDVIAIFGQRSFGQIASMMASLLCGGVFLTVDRNLPVNRQQLILQEANAKYALYVGDISHDDMWINNDASFLIINVDAHSGDCQNLRLPDISSKQNLPFLDPDDAAYIFFTSGTTGVPKGILGCHKGLSHFLTWQRNKFNITPHDRCSQLINVSFDAILRDIFLPLTSGATICLPTDDGNRDPAEVLPWLEREKVTVVHTVPGLAHIWFSNQPPELFLHSLRLVFFSGEQLNDTLVNHWRKVTPLSCKVVNLYGATETTLIKSYYQIPGEIRPGAQPVGWTLPETQILVMKKNNMLCGIGEPGEIIIRTPFRTLGYINAPEENKKKFVKNPCGNDESDLIYYTGDLGCYGLDGALEIHGRIDHQIKIRGVRVEPDEITALLSQHPQIKYSIIVPRKNRQSQDILVAYVVLREPDRAAERELRSFLGKQLAAAMVPAVFLFLEQLPLTHNGKVDRQALPSSDSINLNFDRVYIAPRTDVEKTLTAHWCKIFDLEKIGIHDNYFELGGHSLMATQLTAQIRSIFDVEISLRDFFEVPTVEEMAILISQYQTEKVEHDELEQMLSQIEALSDEETQTRLSNNDLSV